MNVFALVIVFKLVFLIYAAARASDINVLDYGAVSEDTTDNSEAFLKAWNEICSREEDNPTMIIPEETFLVYPVVFSGPCKPEIIKILLLGEIVAPASPDAWKGREPSQWVVFQKVSGLRIDGPGTIDGRGSAWWNQSCRDHPTLSGCTKLAPTVTNVAILAPERSPNTDGISVHVSNNVRIKHVNIGTGDDCISIGDHTYNVYISNIRCGPGHGISIGSLGRSGNYVKVENIYVNRAYLKGTTNGARIKTWQVGKGYVRGVRFENFYLDSIRNPIIIDQNYCDVRGACNQKNSGVHISDVTYSEFYGSSSSAIAINLNCSQSVACTDIILRSIELMPANFGQMIGSFCNNAYGITVGVVEPESCLED